MSNLVGKNVLLYRYIIVKLVKSLLTMARSIVVCECQMNK